MWANSQRVDQQSTCSSLQGHGSDSITSHLDLPVFLVSPRHHLWVGHQSCLEPLFHYSDETRSARGKEHTKQLLCNSSGRNKNKNFLTVRYKTNTI